MAEPDITARLMQCAAIGTTVGPNTVKLLDDARIEIERLRLFERYSNRDIEGQVEAAIRYKAEHGKYPFED